MLLTFSLCTQLVCQKNWCLHSHHLHAHKAGYCLSCYHINEVTAQQPTTEVMNGLIFSRMLDFLVIFFYYKKKHTEYMKYIPGNNTSKFKWIITDWVPCDGEDGRRRREDGKRGSTPKAAGPLEDPAPSSYDAGLRLTRACHQKEQNLNSMLVYLEIYITTGKHQ